MTKFTDTGTPSLLEAGRGYDPIEDRLRQTVRATIEALFEEELEAFIGRCRYGRSDVARKGYRHGHRDRQLTGTFGTETALLQKSPWRRASPFPDSLRPRARSRLGRVH